MARAATKRAFDAGLEAAITAYKSSVKRGEYGQGPFAVASGIRENVYKEIRSREEDSWRLSYNKSTSQVFLYGDPSRAHERASRWFDAKIGAYAIENGLEDELAQSGAATVDLPGVIKEPDFSLLLARDHHCPALVAEVACHNESMAALRRSLHDWTCPGFAAMALGVSISRGSGQEGIKTVVLKKTCWSSLIEEFDIVDDSPELSIVVDLASLGDGSSNPALDGKAIKFDLKSLRKTILAATN